MQPRLKKLWPFALLLALLAPIAVWAGVDLGTQVEIGSGKYSVQHAKIALASASATEVVAAQGAGKTIVVVGFKISASAACNVKWVENTASATDLSGLTYLAANGGWTGGLHEGRSAFLYETSANVNLGIDSSAADAMSIEVWYIVR